MDTILASLARMNAPMPLPAAWTSPPASRSSAPAPAAPCFDFHDLQALREEYEERIARLERDKAAALDVVKREADNRVAALHRAHAQQLATDAGARQQLIEELTIELAAARELGEVRATDAERARAVAERQLAQVRVDVARVEAELGRIRSVLDVVVSAPKEPPREVALAAPIELVARKRKIRLR